MHFLLYYVGENRFIECVGGIGMREGVVKNGVIEKGSRFTHWFKDYNINYEESFGKINIIVDDKEYYVKGFLINDYNYVSLRDIGKVLNYSVKYDVNKKTPIFKKI